MSLHQVIRSGLFCAADLDLNDLWFRQGHFFLQRHNLTDGFHSDGGDYNSDFRVSAVSQLQNLFQVSGAAADEGVGGCRQCVKTFRSGAADNGKVVRL